MVRYSNRNEFAVDFASRVAVVDKKTVVGIEEHGDDETLGRLVKLIPAGSTRTVQEVVVVVDRKGGLKCFQLLLIL